MIDLSGKVVLVTGAGRGIGAAIVRAVVRTGGKAVLHDVTAGGNADAMQKELGAEHCHTIGGDLADGASVPKIWQAAQAWQGRIDVLVNNAGIYERADVDFDFERWAASWHRTLRSTWSHPAISAAKRSAISGSAAAALSSIWLVAQPFAATTMTTCTMPRRRPAWWR
jgi:NAD(P)-dependent dehydrogenase (short-subunit alcohol dehydrogenase family)